MYTVLIVDDEIGFQCLLELVLQRAGYRTLVASDGAEALELIRQHHPHLIITDDDMPRMQGSELCRQLKGDPALRHIPAIIHSASLKMQRPAYRESSRADAFLSKPSLPREILERVRGLITQSQTVRGEAARVH